MIAGWLCPFVPRWYQHARLGAFGGDDDTVDVQHNLIDITSGLRFPEGPIALPDGSVLLVEIAAGQLTRVQPDGSKEVVATPGGGPNGAAIGPDGRVYLCNNGGMNFVSRDGLLLPANCDDDTPAGRIEAVDLNTGAVEVLYTECNGHAFSAPNDLVFDADGGMWFTDHGKIRRHNRDLGGVFYAHADGSEVRRVVGHLDGPNGIGLSPDGKVVYVAETHTGRIWGFDISAPGKITPSPLRPAPWLLGRLVANPPGLHLFDSLAIDAEGNVVVASIPGSIETISPNGETVESVPMPDRFPTNVCFGGDDLRTGYMTLSGSGKLVSRQWPRAGLALHFLNR